MTNDDGRKPEGAPERSSKARVGAPSGVDGNGPKRFSVQRKMAIVARLLRGEPLELVARETNVLIARLTECREREVSVRCSWPSCCHDRQQGPHLGRRMNSAGAAQQALGFESVAQRQEVHRGTRELASLTFHVLCLFQLGPASAAGLGAVEQGAADWTLHHGVNQVSR